jgi:hypothetical protein
MDQIIEGINKINQNYSVHQKAAQNLAVRYFEAKKVCHDLLVQAGIA